MRVWSEDVRFAMSNKGRLLRYIGFLREDIAKEPEGSRKRIWLEGRLEKARADLRYWESKL